MKTIIYYYTGTGNSLWTARLLAAEIGGAELYSMAGAENASASADADAVGLVFPVHIWGVPGLVIRFLEHLRPRPGTYCFAAAVNAGQVSRTLIQLKHLMRDRGLTLSAGFDVVLPSNYIPWGGPGPAERLEELYREARNKIVRSAGAVKNRERRPVDRGPLWQRIIFTALYKWTFGMVPKLDRDFWTDDKCNACGICEKVCPVGNIAIESGRPVWRHRCEQCLACIQWCPQEAIQYGKKTPAYDRYHHPEVKVKDVITRAG
ncbi:MAG: EFR1 family ferrodoxin [Spirochaetes bacterium]|nr:EFR1 family ferrodoxin [Spirochaetota bacterium]